MDSMKIPMIFVYYLVVVLPIWIIFKFTKNYNVLIGCRYIMKYSFYIMAGYAVAIIIINNIIDANNLILVIGFIALLPFMYNVWEFFFLYKFYASSHVKNLKYFVLYLRSFNDDSKQKKMERKLMQTMYTFFCPFAVGQPNDLKGHPGSALRIYLKDDWKKWVLKMMGRAPIILMRVSGSENFSWEFEQCVRNSYLYKSVLWISNVNSYKVFMEKVEKEYGLSLPPIEDVCNNSVLFKNHDDFVIHKLEDENSYQQFVNRYNEIRELTTTYPECFAGRKENFIQTLFNWKRDPLMPAFTEKWDWSAFFFPEYYIIFHRFPYRILTILVFVYSFFVAFALNYALLLIILNCFFSTEVVACVCVLMCLLFRISVCLYLGRNGKKIVWLAEKWERVEYFEHIYLINSVKAFLYGPLVVLLFIIALLLK